MISDAFGSNRIPFRKVPFVELRSVIKNRFPSLDILAWRRLTLWSFNTRSTAPAIFWMMKFLQMLSRSVQPSTIQWWLTAKRTNKHSTVYSAGRPLANASLTGGWRKLPLNRAEFDTIRKNQWKSIAGAVYNRNFYWFFDASAVLWNHGGGSYDKQTALRR